MGMDEAKFIESALAGTDIMTNICSHCHAHAVGMFESVSYWKDSAGHVRRSGRVAPLCAACARRDVVKRDSREAKRLRKRCEQGPAVANTTCSAFCPGGWAYIPGTES